MLCCKVNTPSYEHITFYLSILLLMDIQLLKFMAADNSAVVNILAPLFWGIMYAFLLDIHPDGILLGHKNWASFVAQSVKNPPAMQEI